MSKRGEFTVKAPLTTD